MSKKSAIITVLISVVIIIGALLYYYFYYSTNTINTPEAGNSETENVFGGASGDKNIGGNTGGKNTEPIKIDLETLRQVYNRPTSGSVFFLRDKKTVMRFTDRANGNTYEYIPETGISAIRITNTTLPKIQEAIWSSNGTNLLLRTLSDDNNTIKTQKASLKISTTTGTIGEISTEDLPLNIHEVAINPKGDKILALTPNTEGGTTGTMFTFTDKSQKKIFESPIGLWNISWPSDNTILFTTKSSYLEQGYSYFFNPTTISFVRVLGNSFGLSAVSNNPSNLVALSKITDKIPTLFVYDMKTKKLDTRDIRTLAEKCAWGKVSTNSMYCGVPTKIPSASSPDAWYQGTEHFTDNIWYINPNKATQQLAETHADMIDLKVSPDDKFLSFRNKNDYSLWVLDIEKAASSSVEFDL